MKKSSKISAPILHPEQLLTARQVCEMLGWSRKTLYNYTHTYKGRPPLLSSIKFRSRNMFRPQLVEYFLEQLELKGIYFLEKDLT